MLDCRHSLADEAPPISLKSDSSLLLACVQMIDQAWLEALRTSLELAELSDTWMAASK